MCQYETEVGKLFVNLPELTENILFHPTEVWLCSAIVSYVLLFSSSVFGHFLCETQKSL